MSGTTATREGVMSVVDPFANLYVTTDVVQMNLQGRSWVTPHLFPSSQSSVQD